MTKTTSNIVIGTTLLLALGAVAGHMLGEPFMKLLHPDQVQQEQQQVSQSPSVQVSGNLLASLKPKGTEGATAGIYKINPTTGEAILESDTNDYFAPALSHDGSRIAVVGNDGEDVGQLFVADVTQPDEAQSYAPPTPALWAGPANWSSDDSLIAYEALGALPDENDTAIENSYVVVLDPENGEQQIIDFGVSPLFAPDDSIVYLKTDGIYRQHLKDGAPFGEVERLALFDGYAATRNSQIALSPDGSLIAVTHPESSLIMMFAVYGSGGIVELVPMQGLVHTATWPVFSPDGTHLAFVSLEGSTDEKLKRTIVIMNLATEVVREVTPLDTYSLDNLSLSGWFE